MSFDSLWQNETLRSSALLSIAYVAGVIVIQLVLLRIVRKAAWLDDAERLAWLGRVRLGAGLALVGGLALLWASELEALALSAVAIAAAIVLATKELIMCVSGGVVRRVSGAFDIGDRIELAGQRGDVIRIGLFSMTLLEVGPGQQRTGRAVTLPNSVLLGQAVVNESFTDEYVLHVTTVEFVPEARWQEAEQELLTAARAACAEHLERAREHMERSSAEHGLSTPSVEPRVFVQISGDAQRTLFVRFPAPARERARMEQQILRSYRAVAADAEAEPD